MSDNMRTITLRTLVREPLKVKRMTRTGHPVQVTDHGQPLWIIRPANGAAGETKRQHDTNQILDEVLRERPSKVSAARLLEESRR
jgi:hypothetical protein